MENAQWNVEEDLGLTLEKWLSLQLTEELNALDSLTLPRTVTYKDVQVIN